MKANRPPARSRVRQEREGARGRLPAAPFHAVGSRLVSTVPPTAAECGLTVEHREEAYSSTLGKRALPLRDTAPLGTFASASADAANGFLERGDCSLKSAARPLLATTEAEVFCGRAAQLFGGAAECARLSLPRSARYPRGGGPALRLRAADCFESWESSMQAALRTPLSW